MNIFWNNNNLTKEDVQITKNIQKNSKVDEEIDQMFNCSKEELNDFIA